MNEEASVVSDGLHITTDISYGRMPRQRLDIVRPAEMAPGAPILIYFHGGGWRTGRKSLFTYIAQAVAQEGAVAIVPSYRLFPRVKFPDFLRDCAAAVAWVQANRARTGNGRLFLMGHSAGAYNAMMLGLDRTWLRGAGADPDGVAGVIGLAGLYDFLPVVDAKRQPIFSASAGPETQPITFARADAPSLLLVTGAQDREVPPRNAEALAARMHAIGGRAQLLIYEGVNHIELVRGFRPGSVVLRDVMAFMAGQPIAGAQGVAQAVV